MTANELTNTVILNINGVDSTCILLDTGRDDDVNRLNISVLEDLVQIKRLMK